MMDFDQLVRKYLSGALTDAELDEFRDLLQRVPEYREELRQTLELRSLIHDDTLKLNPPEELSATVRAAVGGRFAETGTEAMFRRDAMSLTPPADLSNSVRMAVAAKFAGDAIEEPEKKKRRKGLLWIPYRIAAGAFATASIAVILAISPTLFAPFGDRAVTGGQGTSSQPAIARLQKLPAPAGGALNGSYGSGSYGSGSYGASGSASPGMASDATGTSLVGSTSSDRMVGSTLAPHAASGTSATVRQNGTNGGDRAGSLLAATPYRSSGTVIDNAFVSPLAEGIPTRVTPRAIHSPANEKQGERNMEKAIAANSQPAILGMEAIELVGGMRGLDATSYNPSSDTINNHMIPITPAPSIAVARNEVAGEEAGRLLAVGVTLGSGSVDATSPTVLMGSSCYFSFSVSGYDRVGVEMGGSTFQQDNSTREMLFDGFAKQSQGLPTDGAPEVEPVKASKTKSVPTTPPSSQRLKQQITYGGVFYDRRLKLSEKWDICGRVNFGGADGSLVGGVRAYGSFSPSKNVSLTMGVGSSALYDLTSKKTWGSANYGIYYGVETGF